MSERRAVNRVRHVASVVAMPDGSVRASFVVQRMRKAAVLCLEIDPVGEAASGGSAVVPVADALGPAGSVFSLVAMEPLGRRECRALGLYGDGPGPVVDAFERFAAGTPAAAAPDAGADGRTELERRYGIVHDMAPCLAGLNAGARLPPGAGRDRSDLPGHPQFADRLHGHVRAWIDRVRANVQGPAGLWFLSPGAWTDPLCDWLDAGGEAGERRRQAARLQCGFAPVLAVEPAVVAAVDAGKPFEPALLDVARGWLRAGLGDRLDLPRIKRLRGVDFAGIDGMVALLEFTALAPLHLLPPPGGAPLEMSWLLREAAGEIGRMGLAPSEVLADPMPRWLAREEAGDHPASRYVRLARALAGARRVATSLSRDLVRPLMADWSLSGAALGRGEFESLAGRLLFGGLPLARIEQAAGRWHSDVDRLQEAARSGSGTWTWPALFEPFDGPGGVTISCLTTSLELSDEGHSGPDVETGMQGMGHCVGTYAEECRDGDIHVASVRRDGRRLSTLALSVDGKGRLKVDEHRGRANSEPPSAALEAVSELLRAHARGRLRLNPEATAPRRPGAWRPDTPEAVLARVHAAWRPHLPRGGEGLLAMESCLAAMLKRDARAGVTDGAARAA